MPSASRLTERVTIQGKTETRTDTGGVEEAWSDLTARWARTWGATGQEKIAAASGATMTRHFCIRYYPTLTTKHRVLFRGQSYNVTFVNHIQAEGVTYFDATETDGREAQ